MVDEQTVSKIIQIIVNTIDEFYCGYRINEMKNKIIDEINKWCVAHYSDATLYNVIVDSETFGNNFTYMKGLIKPIADFETKRLNEKTCEFSNARAMEVQ